LESNGNSGTRKHKIEILEIENMVTEIKGFFFLVRLINSLDTEEERISEPEDSSVEIIQTEKQR
jgi:hypothetical protein